MKDRSIETIEGAQRELRRAYLRGGPGTFISGLVWLVAGAAAHQRGVRAGFLLLYFGGMLIFPLSQLITRGLLREPTHQAGTLGARIVGNNLSNYRSYPRIVGETVVPMLGGLLGAWLLLPYRPLLVFPVAAVAVGAHYFGFRSAYGDRTFWLLGSILCAIGLIPIFLITAPAHMVAYAVSGVELLIGLWLTGQSRSHLNP